MATDTLVKLHLRPDEASTPTNLFAHPPSRSSNFNIPTSRFRNAATITDIPIIKSNLSPEKALQIGQSYYFVPGFRTLANTSPTDSACLKNSLESSRRASVLRLRSIIKDEYCLYAKEQLEKRSKEKREKESKARHDHIAVGDQSTSRSLRSRNSIDSIASSTNSYRTINPLRSFDSLKEKMADSIAKASKIARDVVPTPRQRGLPRVDKTLPNIPTSSDSEAPSLQSLLDQHRPSSKHPNPTKAPYPSIAGVNSSTSEDLNNRSSSKPLTRGDSQVRTAGATQATRSSFAKSRNSRELEQSKATVYSPRAKLVNIKKTEQLKEPSESAIPKPKFISTSPYTLNLPQPSQDRASLTGHVANHQSGSHIPRKRTTSVDINNTPLQNKRVSQLSNREQPTTPLQNKRVSQLSNKSLPTTPPGRLLYHHASREFSTPKQTDKDRRDAMVETPRSGELYQETASPEKLATPLRREKNYGIRGPKVHFAPDARAVIMGPSPSRKLKNPSTSQTSMIDKARGLKNSLKNISKSSIPKMKNNAPTNISKYTTSTSAVKPAGSNKHGHNSAVLSHVVSEQDVITTTNEALALNNLNGLSDSHMRDQSQRFDGLVTTAKSSNNEPVTPTRPQVAPAFAPRASSLLSSPEHKFGVPPSPPVEQNSFAARLSRPTRASQARRVETKTKSSAARESITTGRSPSGTKATTTGNTSPVVRSPIQRQSFPGAPSASGPSAKLQTFTKNVGLATRRSSLYKSADGSKKSKSSKVSGGIMAGIKKMLPGHRQPSRPVLVIGSPMVVGGSHPLVAEALRAAGVVSGAGAGVVGAAGSAAAVVDERLVGNSQLVALAAAARQPSPPSSPAVDAGPSARALFESQLLELITVGMRLEHRLAETTKEFLSLCDMGNRVRTSVAAMKQLRDGVSESYSLLTNIYDRRESITNMTVLLASLVDEVETVGNGVRACMPSALAHPPVTSVADGEVTPGAS